MTQTGFLRALEEIFGLEPRTLQESASRETVAEWTSLADTQIFTLIGSELGIEPDGALIEAETVGDLVAELRGRGAFE